MSSITVVVQNCGLTGLAAIKALNAAAGNCTVRVASRDAAKLSEKLAEEGAKAEVFQTGDDALFADADRFICIPPGGTPAPETRVSVALDFLTKVKAAGAKHGVVLSVIVADRRRGLFGSQWGEVEDAAAQDGVTVVSVRAPMFYGNMWGDVATVKSHDTFYMPIAGDTRQISAAVADVGAAMATAVLDASLGNKIIHVVGDHLTKNEIATLYSKKLEREVKFAQASKEAATEAFKAFGMPLWQIEGVIELFDNVETDSFVDAHRGEFQALVGRPTMTVEQYIDTALIHGLK